MIFACDVFRIRLPTCVLVYMPTDFQQTSGDRLAVTIERVSPPGFDSERAGVNWRYFFQGHHR